MTEMSRAQMLGSANAAHPWRTYGRVLADQPTMAEASSLLAAWADSEGVEMLDGSIRLAQFPDARWKLSVLARPRHF